MKHAAVVFLLVAMAAAPVTSVACVAWCFPAETSTTTACHHESVTLAIIGVEESCDSVLAISPFLKEEIQMIVQAVLPAGAPPGFLTSAPGEAQLATGRDVAAAVSGGATSPLVLRL